MWEFDRLTPPKATLREDDFSGLGNLKSKTLVSSTMHSHSREFEIASATFAKIRGAFPAFTMNLELHPAHVELAMDIPVQPGLSFKLWLDLQNRDELTLSASHFWYEWFPCTNQMVVDEYLEAVLGLLSGRFRILEHWRGGRVVKAQLQSPRDSKWKSVATSTNISGLIPWPPKKLRVVQNSSNV